MGAAAGLLPGRPEWDLPLAAGMPVLDSHVTALARVASTGATRHFHRHKDGAPVKHLGPGGVGWGQKVSWTRVRGGEPATRRD